MNAKCARYFGVCSSLLCQRETNTWRTNLSLLGCANGRCYCGEAHEQFDKHGHEICDMPCSGDNSLICGGNGASNVFSIY